MHVLPAGLDAELTEFAQSFLRSHLDRSAGPTVAEAAVRHGTVVHETLSEAADRGADVLVVGAHGGHWLTSPLLGSTPENLVRASQVPVLVVKNPPEGAYRTVMLAVDTTPDAAEAAHTACALTPPADHIVVHVTVVVGENLMRMHGASEEHLAQLREVSTEQVRGDIENMAAELKPAAARVVIKSGRPQTLLPELSRHYAADLVALGTGGRSSLGYALLGSVAQHVLRDAVSDVLVVPARKG
jgi:nucleotide-binding universal stress UspA family protein